MDWLDEYMEEWMNWMEMMDGWMFESMDGRLDCRIERRNGCLEWLDGWMNE